MKALTKLSFCLLFYCGLFAQTAALREIQKVSKGNEIKLKPLYGVASYYADKFNGRQTANGSIYSHSKLTAACNVLPLNTWIRVTNLRNNRAVVVQVNDRLHPKNKRIVDLSRIAATELGYIGRGLTQVKVEVLGTKRVKNKGVQGDK